MLAAALGGIGLAVLPYLIGDDEPGLVRLTPRVLATRELALVYPREARLAQPVQAVIRFVIDVMRANAAQIAGSAERLSAPARGSASSPDAPGCRSSRG